MAKTIAKKTASVSHPILAQASGAGVTDPVPTTASPTPPTGYVPTKLGKGLRPQRAQIAIATKVASELRSSTTYAQQFGSSAPDAAAVADALDHASAWSGTLQNATAWYQYVKQQENLAWKHALGSTEALRVPFEFHLSRDATVGEALPSTAKFFGASKEAAKKGAATRKRNEAAGTTGTKKKGTATAPASPPATSATPTKLLN